MDELTPPYATVIDIDKGRLPNPEVVAEWNGKRFAEALRHDQSCGRYNPDLQAAYTRRVQGRGGNGKGIYRCGGGLRTYNRAECNGEYLSEAH